MSHLSQKHPVRRAEELHVFAVASRKAAAVLLCSRELLGDESRCSLLFALGFSHAATVVKMEIFITSSRGEATAASVLGGVPSCIAHFLSSHFGSGIMFSCQFTGMSQM